MKQSYHLMVILPWMTIFMSFVLGQTDQCLWCNSILLENFSNCFSGKLTLSSYQPQQIESMKKRMDIRETSTALSEGAISEEDAKTSLTTALTSVFQYAVDEDSASNINGNVQYLNDAFLQCYFSTTGTRDITYAMEIYHLVAGMKEVKARRSDSSLGITQTGTTTLTLTRDEAKSNVDTTTISENTSENNNLDNPKTESQLLPERPPPSTESVSIFAKALVSDLLLSDKLCDFYKTFSSDTSSICSHQAILDSLKGYNDEIATTAAEKVSNGIFLIPEKSECSAYVKVISLEMTKLFYAYKAIPESNPDEQAHDFTSKYIYNLHSFSEIDRSVPSDTRETQHIGPDNAVSIDGTIGDTNGKPDSQLDQLSTNPITVDNLPKDSESILVSGQPDNVTPDNYLPQSDGMVVSDAATSLGDSNAFAGSVSKVYTGHRLPVNNIALQGKQHRNYIKKAVTFNNNNRRTIGSTSNLESVDNSASIAQYDGQVAKLPVISQTNTLDSPSLLTRKFGSKRNKFPVNPKQGSPVVTNDISSVTTSGGSSVITDSYPAFTGKNPKYSSRIYFKKKNTVNQPEVLYVDSNRNQNDQSSNLISNTQPFPVGTEYIQGSSNKNPPNLPLTEPITTKEYAPPLTIENSENKISSGYNYLLPPSIPNSDQTILDGSKNSLYHKRGHYNLESLSNNKNNQHLYHTLYRKPQIPIEAPTVPASFLAENTPDSQLFESEYISETNNAVSNGNIVNGPTVSNINLQDAINQPSLDNPSQTNVDNLIINSKAYPTSFSRLRTPYQRKHIGGPTIQSFKKSNGNSFKPSIKTSGNVIASASGGSNSVIYGGKRNMVTQNKIIENYEYVPPIEDSKNEITPYSSDEPNSQFVPNESGFVIDAISRDLPTNVDTGSSSSVNTYSTDNTGTIIESEAPPQNVEIFQKTLLSYFLGSDEFSLFYGLYKSSDVSVSYSYDAVLYALNKYGENIKFSVANNVINSIYALSPDSSTSVYALAISIAFTQSMYNFKLISYNNPYEQGFFIAGKYLELISIALNMPPNTVTSPTIDSTMELDNQKVLDNAPNAVPPNDGLTNANFVDETIVNSLSDADELNTLKVKNSELSDTSIDSTPIAESKETPFSPEPSSVTSIFQKTKEYSTRPIYFGHRKLGENSMLNGVRHSSPLDIPSSDINNEPLEPATITNEPLEPATITNEPLEPATITNDGANGSGNVPDYTQTIFHTTQPDKKNYCKKVIEWCGSD